jgi:hypothetical protein
LQIGVEEGVMGERYGANSVGEIEAYFFLLPFSVGVGLDQADGPGEAVGDLVEIVPDEGRGEWDGGCAGFVDVFC